MNVLVFGFSLLLLATVSISKEPDYYWRDYRGVVAQDAVMGSQDDQGRKSYIGHADVFGGGLYVGQLFPGNTKITVTGPPGVIHVTDKFLQILCSPHQEMFRWVPTTSEGINHIPYHLVVGGHQNADPGVLYIGRTNHAGSTLIGKVIGYLEGSGRLYYPYENRELSTDTFEVLTYNDTSDRF